MNNHCALSRGQRRIVEALNKCELVTICALASQNVAFVLDERASLYICSLNTRSYLFILLAEDAFYAKAKGVVL